MWTILIPTLGQRRDLLSRLLDGLMPQVDAAAGAAKVLAWWDNGEAKLADKRQVLVEAVDTEYLSFVDDDDTVSEDYVPSVLEAMASGPDCIGMLGDVYFDGRYYGLCETSLKHKDWIDPPIRDGVATGLILRDITHIRPMRASIARTVDFRAAESAIEDRPWAAQLRAGGLLRTEVMVPKVLYHYLWSRHVTAWRHPERIRAVDAAGQPFEPLHVDSPHFSYLEVSRAGSGR